jgi:hypothetical protein
MRKAITAASLGVGAWLLCGCMADAAPEEIQKMCENFARLNGVDKVPTKATLAADVDQMFSQLEKDAKVARDEQVKLWENDLKVQLAAAKDDAAKASLQSLMDERKKQADEKLQLDLAAFTPRRAEELAKVDALIKAAKAELEGQIKKCTDKANAEKVSQKVAQCRIDAKTIDKFTTMCY